MSGDKKNSREVDTKLANIVFDAYKRRSKNQEISDAEKFIDKHPNKHTLGIGVASEYFLGDIVEKGGKK